MPMSSFRDSRVLFSSDGYKLSLTTAALTRCSNNGKPGCPVMSSLLGYQTGGSGSQWGGAQITDPNVFRSRLMSYYNNQVNCYIDTQNNGDSQPQNCPRESHDLNHYSTTTSWTTCVGGDPHHRREPRLRNALHWAGGNQNPYLAFEVDPNVAGDVKIDPIDGGTGAGSSGTGACDAALNPVWINGAWKCDNSTDSNKLGLCCTCNGQQRTWKAALMAGQYQCKL